MRLGTQTGSMTNHLYSRGVIGQPEPTEGMGATLLSWTDRHAATVLRVFSVGKTRLVSVQEDKAMRSDKNGMSESQTYTYETNPTGRVLTFKQEKNGMWSEVAFSTTTKRWSKTGGYGLRIGQREEYRDFSF